MERSSHCSVSPGPDNLGCRADLSDGFSKRDREIDMDLIDEGPCVERVVLIPIDIRILRILEAALYPIEYTIRSLSGGPR